MESSHPPIVPGSATEEPLLAATLLIAMAKAANEVLRQQNFTGGGPYDDVNNYIAPAASSIAKWALLRGRRDE